MQQHENYKECKLKIKDTHEFGEEERRDKEFFFLFVFFLFRVE